MRRKSETECSAVRRCLTPRSSGAPTAGHQARSGGTRYIFASPGLASCRRRPVSSNDGRMNAIEATGPFTPVKSARPGLQRLKSGTACCDALLGPRQPRQTVHKPALKSQAGCGSAAQGDGVHGELLKRLNGCALFTRPAVPQPRLHCGGLPGPMPFHGRKRPRPAPWALAGSA